MEGTLKQIATTTEKAIKEILSKHIKCKQKQYERIVEICVKYDLNIGHIINVMNVELYKRKKKN